MAPTCGELEAPSLVVAELAQCLWVPKFTQLHRRALVPGSGDSTAGWSLRDTSREILTCGCRSQGGSYSIISHGKKLAQE